MPQNRPNLRPAWAAALAFALAGACDDEPSGPERSQCSIWLECYMECRVELEIEDDEDGSFHPEQGPCQDRCRGIGRSPGGDFPSFIEPGLLEDCPFPSALGDEIFEPIRRCIVGDLD